MIIQSEAMLTDAVCADVARTPDERQRQLSTPLVRHLHAIVREVRPTEEEWDKRPGRRHRPRPGHQRHNETILAADILGLSSLVGILNGATLGGETAAALLAPFWRLNLPKLPLGESIARDGTPGIPAPVRGRVTCEGRPVAGAVVDVWQAEPRGMYDNQIDAPRARTSAATS